MGLGGGGGSGGGGGGGGGTEFSDWFTRFWSSSTAWRTSVQKGAETSHLAPFTHIKEKKKNRNLSQNQVLGIKAKLEISVGNRRTS